MAEPIPPKVWWEESNLPPWYFVLVCVESIYKVTLEVFVRHHGGGVTEVHGVMMMKFGGCSLVA